MKMLYFADTETISIQMLSARVERQDASDLDVTLFLNDGNKIADILIENAPRHFDLARLQKERQFG